MLFIPIIFILLCSSIFAFFGKRLHIANVVMLILCGLVINIPIIERIFIGEYSKVIFTLGDIGFVSLMFLAGLESSAKLLIHEEKEATIIALFTTILPLISGFVVSLFLGFSFIPAFIVGVCMSITAEATQAQVLMELKRLNTRLGSAMMGAGLINDIFGLSLFILIAYITREVHFYDDLLIVIAIIIFLFGVLIQKKLKKNRDIVIKMEKLLKWLIIPFFFVSVGLHINMHSLIVSPAILIIMILTATFGKFLGAFLSKPFLKFDLDQTFLISWAMNSRGVVGMALALIAFKSGFISDTLYSALVIMTITTTLIFPFFITKIVRDHPRVMQ